MTYLLIMDAKSRCEADRSAVYIRTFLKTVLGFLLSGTKDPTLRAERRLFFAYSIVIMSLDVPRYCPLTFKMISGITVFTNITESASYHDGWL